MWDGAIVHTSNQSLLALIEVFDELDIDHWPLEFPRFKSVWFFTVARAWKQVEVKSPHMGEELEENI